MATRCVSEGRLLHRNPSFYLCVFVPLRETLDFTAVVQMHSSIFLPPFSYQLWIELSSRNSFAMEGTGDGGVVEFMQPWYNKTFACRSQIQSIGASNELCKEPFPMNHDLETIARIAQARKTVKILAESELPTTSDAAHTIDRLLACAGWAPFHKVCHAEHRQGELNGIEPWRFHCLDAQQCRKLGHQVSQLEAAGKIPAMLAAASHLIIATWLPNPPIAAAKAELSVVADEAFEPTIDNVEHIAAASAAIQTLLLAATAAGISNYWSSGGVLRTPALFSKLGIPSNQRLLGAIFLFPAEVPVDCSVEIATSKLRAQRSSSSAGWSRVVKLPT